MNRITKLVLCFSLFYQTACIYAQTRVIYLPEHPRPDWERSEWINLNGEWDFQFDKSNQGKAEKWFLQKSFNKKIEVPFPWGSELSRVTDDADIGWYQKNISIPSGKNWEGKRIFLVIGASDWETEVWIDSIYLGAHRGGYMPFEFELSKYAKMGKAAIITIRVDDKRREFTLYGKQGYGNARGIWQTIYLEARGTDYAEAAQFTPDIDKQEVSTKIIVPHAVDFPRKYELEINMPDGSVLRHKDTIPVGSVEHRTKIKINNPRLWSLEDPYLYTTTLCIGNDKVQSYFGMRKISVTKLPGTNFPYIALNNKPIYLQLALDQSYHPKGFYTFPSDEFMKNEILLAKNIGLNGIRTHIKPDIPRKLYWADKLGLLVMADLPNSWGEPEPQARDESERTLKQMIIRDYNHPSIFSWIVFNESWGLSTKVKTDENKIKNQYLPETQLWVASMYYLTKSLDPSRLVEDNSICCGGGHTHTDIYSWHEYLPGWEWDNHLKKIVENNFSGSEFHFEKGYKQSNQPNINSECGNVWGYQGSTGDVDWSYDYHRMINSFRKYPQVAGWLYTEHHDVINEWNGYWRFDRSEKDLGLGEIVPGMTIKDFHSPVYLSTGNDITYLSKANAEVNIPLYLSVYKESLPENKVIIRYHLNMMDRAGDNSNSVEKEITIPVDPFAQKSGGTIKLIMPESTGLAVLRLYTLSATGDTLHRNFVHFLIQDGQDPNKTIIHSVKPSMFDSQKWSLKQWNIMDGKKVNGAGNGVFSYSIPIIKDWKQNKVMEAYLLMEMSAKTLFDKDKEASFDANQDYMKGSRVSASKNPNAYPMTDELKFPSTVKISINNKVKKSVTLPDDPADHRGVLSWHAQLKDRKLREAGSYGYLVKVPITNAELAEIKRTKKVSIKLETLGDGGIALYGAEFGRYPVDIELVVKEK